MIPEIKKPSECTKAELEAFAKLVTEGGQVGRSGLERLIRRAKLLGFAYEGNELVSISAVKRSSWLYIRDVFAKANEPDEAIDYKYEVGWGFTRPEYRNRGIHECMVDLMLENMRGTNLFLTTGINNRPVSAIFTKRQFQKCGSPYQGRTEPKQVWVRKITSERTFGVRLLECFDQILRQVERSESCSYLLTMFRRKTRKRLIGVQ